MSAPCSVAIVGVGKIARDQHVPAIAASPAFALAATVSRSGGLPGVENHADLAGLLAARPDIAAVALCNPPGARFEAARAAIAAGRHVMLEKPPGATLGELEALTAQARRAGVALLATWHSRYAPAVPAATAWLAGRRVRAVRIDWREDVRRWHPGQQWIWAPGGFGVFDPGINALSILTAILPETMIVTAATLETPENRDAPIAAALTMTAVGDAGAHYPVSVALDWRQEGPQSWDIAVECDGGRLALADGGATLSIDGREIARAPEAEYPGLYARFAALIAARAIDADAAPLRIVADAFLVGRRVTVEPFVD